MRTTKLLITATLTSLGMGAFAQDFNDVSTASHTFNMSVAELALLDIYDANTGLEAGVIQFDMANTNSEAGLYSWASQSYTDLYLNYTSIVGQAAAGFDATRQILVQMESGSFPGSLDLRITPEAPVLTDPNGGELATAGQITPGGVALGKSNPIGSDALLVNNIGSVYTGDEAAGVRLTYTLEQNGNFADYKAGNYSTVIRYTITDL